MKIAIARHGETQFNVEHRFLSSADVEINAEGRKQAAVLANWASAFRPTCMLSSPLLRARQTANIVTEQVALRAAIDGRLREREASAFEGLTIEQLVEKRKALGHVFIDATQDWEGVASVESDDQVFERFRSTVASVSDHLDERVLVISHAGVAKSVFHQVFAVAPNRPCILKVRNGGVLIFDYQSSGAWSFLGLVNPEWL